MRTKYLVLLATFFAALLPLMLWYQLIAKAPAGLRPFANLSRVSQNPSTQEQTTKLVELFYQQYLNDHSLEHRQAVLDQYATSQLASTALQGELAADPIICTQDIPRSFKVTLVDQRPTSARYRVIFSFNSSARPVDVNLALIDDEWLISNVVCVENTEAVPFQEAEGYETAVLYFGNQSFVPDENSECGVVYGIERQIPLADSYEQQLQLRLQELVMGTTTKEQQEGYHSIFDNLTTQQKMNLIKEVKVEGYTAYVNLVDLRDWLPGASSSCGSQELVAPLAETVKHDRQVNKVIFAIEGNSETFYEWIQVGCQEGNDFCDDSVWL